MPGCGWTAEPSALAPVFSLAPDILFHCWRILDYAENMDCLGCAFSQWFCFTAAN